MGLGNMGYLHLMNSCHMSDVNIISVADKSKTNLKKAENIGIKKLYEDYNDMINKESKLDAVVISLPNHLHFDSIKLSLEAGLNIFIEKPISISSEECREVIKLVNNEFKQPGRYVVEFNGTNLASGVYFYRLEAGDFIDSKKMVLIK